LSVTPKAHVMEQCIIPFNNKYRLGKKEESFIELGHQIGIKENKLSKEDRSHTKSLINSDTSINRGTNSKGSTTDKESASRSGCQKQGDRGKY